MSQMDIGCPMHSVVLQNGPTVQLIFVRVIKRRCTSQTVEILVYIIVISATETVKPNISSSILPQPIHIVLCLPYCGDGELLQKHSGGSRIL